MRWGERRITVFQGRAECVCVFVCFFFFCVDRRSDFFREKYPKDFWVCVCV